MRVISLDMCGQCLMVIIPRCKYDLREDQVLPAYLSVGPTGMKDCIDQRTLSFNFAMEISDGGLQGRPCRTKLPRTWHFKIKNTYMSTKNACCMGKSLSEPLFGEFWSYMYHSFF